MTTRFVRILLAVFIATFVLQPHKAGAVGACTCARFNDFKDHGCHQSPKSVGSPPAWAEKAGGNQAKCPNCPPAKAPAIAGPDGSDVTTTSIGMPRWWVNEPYINLHIVDEPLSYRMASGDDMLFRLTYKQNYQLPMPDQIPTFYSTYGGSTREQDAANYIHLMQGFAGATPLGSFQEVTNGMTNAAWIHNWQEFIVLWDAKWEASMYSNAPIGIPGAAFSDGTSEALAFMPDGGIDYYNVNQANQSLNSSTQTRNAISQIQLSSLPYAVPTPFYPGAPDTNGIYWGTTTNGMVLSYPDGSQDFFGLTFFVGSSNAITPDSTSIALLTEHVDSHGRTTKLGYSNKTFTNACDGQAYALYRLQYVDDPDGQRSTFVYSTSSPTLPYQLQEIDDPFGRKTTFSYAACGSSQRGWLTGITDAQGNSSTFNYQSGRNGWMSSMVTPYGTNSFYYQQVPESDVTNGFQQRAIYVTEPAGASQLFCYIHNTSNAIASSATPPTVPGAVFDTGLNGGTEEALYHRNSFYWDRRQTAALSSTITQYLPSNLGTAIVNLASSTSDLQKGRTQHWLLGADGVSITETVSSDQDPSPDPGGTIQGARTWYSYGNTTPADTEVSDIITAIATTLPDGSSSYMRYVYGVSGLAPWVVTQNAQSYTKTNGAVGELTNYFTYFYPNYVDVAGISNSLGQFVNFGYNSYHEVTSITNALNQVTKIGYNTANNISSISNYTGQTIAFSYGAGGIPYLSQILWQPQGLAINMPSGAGWDAYCDSNFNCGSLPLIVEMTGPGLPSQGVWFTNTWDSLNRLTSVTYPDGTTTSNVYNILDLSAHKDRLNNWTYYGHDGLQHLTAITNALTNVTWFTWCDCGALTSISNALSNVWYFNYNNQELLTNVSFPDGSSLTWQYDLLGRVTNRFDGLNNAVRFVYNNQSLLTGVSNSYGLLWGCYRDALGRIVTATNVNSVAVTNGYDILGRLTNRVWTGGGTESFSWATNGLVAYTNQDSQWIHFGRDNAGRLIALTNAVQTNFFGWNCLSELTNLTDGLNHKTTWSYDQLGRLTNKANALGTNIIRYGYDADGRLTSRWMMGTNTGYTYDAVGNLKTIVYPALTVTNFYDAINELTKMVDGIGTNGFTYTQTGQLASETGPWPSNTISFGYNQGHRTSLNLQSPSGSLWSQSYSYDGEWRTTGVGSPAGAFTYGYSGSASPLIQTIALPNAAAIVNSYDTLGRLTSTALADYWGHVLDGSAYGIDALGLRTNLTRQLGLSTNGATISYDPIGQLTNWSGTNSNGHLRQNEQLAYAYDAAGNLNIRTNDALVQTFTVDALNQLSNVSRIGTFTETGALAAPNSGMTVNGGSAATYADLTFAASNLTLNNGINSFTNIAENAYGTAFTNIVTANLPANLNFQYDANGNLTNDGTRAFSYDAENRLANAWVSNAWQVGFVYDGLSRRRIERDYQWSGVAWVLTNETHFIYDGLQLAQERDVNNNPLVTYTRGIDLSLSRTGAGGIGGLLARTGTNSSTYYHSDGSGNITALMDGYQRIVARYEYMPFGKTLGQWGSMASVNKMRFSSMPFNDLVGASAYPFRFYDPNLQRWLNRDPIEEAGGINLYKFNRNNPLRFVDPYGLWEQFFREPTPQQSADDLQAMEAAADEATALLNQFLQSLANATYIPGNGIAASEFEGPLENALEKEAQAAADSLLNKLEKPKANCSGKAAPKYGTTPKGRPFTKHYATDTGPQRNIPGSVVDNTIDNTTGIPVEGGKTVYYDPGNNVTVITGDGGSIVSARKGAPREGQY